MPRAVVFDAVGTLIHVTPSVAAIYGEVSRRHGGWRTDDDIALRFRAAFARQEEIDSRANWITSESRELERWRTIVAEVLDDADTGACFAELYAHFARPAAWRVTPGTMETLDELATRCTLAVASNFDHRLHGLIRDMPELRAIEHVVVSADIGARKPSLAFFEAVSRRLNIPPSEIVFVGDDPINDGQGAVAAGMSPILLGRDILDLRELMVGARFQRAHLEAPGT